MPSRVVVALRDVAAVQELKLVELAVDPSFGQELRVRAESHEASLVKDSDRRKLMIQQTYGIPNSVSVIRGYYPPYARDYDMQMSYMHRDEMIRQIIEENLSGLPTKKAQAPTLMEETATRQRTRRPVAAGGSMH